MKKQFLSLGKALNKAEQKQIIAGFKLTQADGPCSGIEGTLPAGCPCNHNYDCSGLCDKEVSYTEGYSGTCS